jgi:hypothetical protein
VNYKSFLKLALLTFAIHVFSQSAHSSQQPENGLELYKRALSFRDGKIEGYTRNESTIQAESIFLELANQGSEKAAHNYAVIQYKQGNYELASEFFQKSSLEASKKNLLAMHDEGKIKEDLYLVAGSNRQAGVSVGSLLDSVWGTDKVDMTHRKTFDGQAVTMDLNPSPIKDVKHIVGDARTFDFCKYNIKAVLLERLPTSIDQDACSADRDNKLENMTKNYLGTCIQNIAKAMKPETPMHIEWHPYVSLAPENMQLELLIDKNPFHGFLHLNVMLNSVFIHGGAVANFKFFPNELWPTLEDMVKKINRLIMSFSTQSPTETPHKLTARTVWEALIIQRMIQLKSMVCLDYYSPTDSTDKLIEAGPRAIYRNFPPQHVNSKISIKGSDGKVNTGIVYERKEFQALSLFNFLIDDIAAEMNAPYVKKYMESIGFGDVSVAKGDNPYNGRKNVWMIRAVKL